jgi:hypothetical protein
MTHKTNVVFKNLAKLLIDSGRFLSVGVFSIVFGVLVFTSFPAQAGTPDGQTPAQETVCDGLSKSLFGLCNAYCEAMDCDSPTPHASEKACANIASKFVERAGSGLPCEQDASISLEKQTNGKDVEGQITIGSEVTFTYEITNSGAVALSITDFEDTPNQGSIIENFTCNAGEGDFLLELPYPLPVGESIICTYVASALPDVYENTAVVTASAGIETLIKEDVSGYIGIPLARISITKSVIGTPNADEDLIVGDPVTFSYVIANTANANLNISSLVDTANLPSTGTLHSIADGFMCNDGAVDFTLLAADYFLAAGSSITCHFDSTVLDGVYTNSVEVKALTQTYLNEVTAVDYDGYVGVEPSPEPLFVFVTDVKYFGALYLECQVRDLSCGGDGLDAADALCQSEANSAEIGQIAGRTYKAWLSIFEGINADSPGDGSGAVDRFSSNTDTPYTLRDGTSIAPYLEGPGGLFDRQYIDSPINKNASGETVSFMPGEHIWTDTRENGSAFWDVVTGPFPIGIINRTHNCDGWVPGETSNQAYGAIAGVSGIGNPWSIDPTFHMDCSTRNRLYCFEQK